MTRDESILSRDWSKDSEIENQEFKRTELVLPPRTPGSTGSLTWQPCLTMGMSEIEERDLKLEEIHKEIQKKLQRYTLFVDNPQEMLNETGRKKAQDLFHDWELLEQELRKPLYAAIVELDINKDIVIIGRVCPIGLLATDWLTLTKLKTSCKSILSLMD